MSHANAGNINSPVNFTLSFTGISAPAELFWLAKNAIAKTLKENPNVAMNVGAPKFDDTA